MKIPRLHILVKSAEEGQKALNLGAPCIQLRNKEISDRMFLDEARKLRNLTQEMGRNLCINDRLDVAQAVQSDFLHLGPGDFPPEEARKMMDPSMGLGVSVDTPKEGISAENSGANYLGAGPFQETNSKIDAGPVLGVEGLHRIVKAVEIPVIAVGSINGENFLEALRSDCHGIAVLSAFHKSSTPEELVARWMSHLGEGK